METEEEREALILNPSKRVIVQKVSESFLKLLSYELPKSDVHAVYC